MPKCIICHLELNNPSNNSVSCPNGHLVHEDCFKEWFIHSKNCPLCHDPYSSDVISKYEGFLKQKEQERLEAEKRSNHKKIMGKIEGITDNIRFLKFVEAIEFMIEKKQYRSAIAMLNSYKDNVSAHQKQMVLFLRGKVNYLREKYDIAIGSLFKLVKEKFDYPEAFLYLGKAYQALGLEDKAKWAFDRC